MRRLLMTILAGGLALGFAACDDDGGSGGELSLAEYFERLIDLDDEYEERGNELDEGFEDAFDDVDVGEEGAITDEQRDAMREVIGRGVSLLNDFADDLDDLNPPAEAEDAHQEYVEATRDFADRFDEIREDLDDVEDAGDFLGLIFTLAGDAQDFADACTALEEFAADNNIKADLDCEGD